MVDVYCLSFKCPVALDHYSGLKADPDSLKVGEMVDYNGPGKQGVDIEGVLDEHELASVSVEIVSTSGRPLFVEVKNYTSRYSTTSLIAQTTKHFKANIIRMVSDTSTTAWKNGKPHLHYEWMGEGFVNPISGMLRTDLINARKAAVLDVCKDMISKRPLKGRVPAFDCETDIAFNIVDALLYPLTTKVDESL